MPSAKSNQTTTVLANPVPSSVPKKPAIEWIRTLSTYKEPQTWRSVFELVVTAGPFFALWAVAIWMASINFWLVLPFALAAAIFLVRLFLIQHDCGHGSFFKNKNLNDWTGRILGVFTVTPYDVWQRSHLIHHSKHGNLDHRGFGDVMTLTVAEYQAKSFWGRVGYRLYRHPLVLFTLGPAFVFLVHHRLPIGLMTQGWRYWVSAMGTNVAIAMLIGSMIFFVGLWKFLALYLLITVLAGMGGVWLFYVQHQFENTVWDRDENWQLHEAALYGSTHYDLPQPLRWLTANIGIHHVHHLYSKIPYYRLAQVLRDHPDLSKIRRLTIWESFKTVNLQLWDEKSRRLVSYATAKRSRA